MHTEIGPLYIITVEAEVVLLPTGCTRSGFCREEGIMRSGDDSGSKHEKDGFKPARILGAHEAATSSGRLPLEVIGTLAEIAELTDGEVKELALSLLTAKREKSLSEEEQALLSAAKEFPNDPELAVFAAEEELNELNEGYAKASLHAAREFPNNGRAQYLAETQILSVYYDDVVITLPDMALLSGYREFPDERDEYFATLVAKEIMGRINADEAEELRVRRGGWLH